MKEEIFEYLASIPGCWCWLNNDYPALPDIFACIDGRLFAFKVKSRRSVVSDAEYTVIQRIIAAGGVAVVVNSVNAVGRILEMKKPAAAQRDRLVMKFN